MTDQFKDILLVEDSHTDAKLTLKALEKVNLAHKVVWVKDGEEALDYVFSRNAFKSRDPKEDPRLIILDLKLPKVDGQEVLETLKNHDLYKLIPVVILTSSNEERDIMKSYYNGVNSYIVKPMEYEDFMKAVRELGMYWRLINQSPIL